MPTGFPPTDLFDYQQKTASKFMGQGCVLLDSPPSPSATLSNNNPLSLLNKDISLSAANYVSASTDRLHW